MSSGSRCGGATGPPSASCTACCIAGCASRGRAAVFGGMLMSATVSLFPLLGRTPPPWRWPADVLATSLGTHVAYVTAVAVVDDAVRRR